MRWRRYVRKHILIVYFVGVVLVFWVLLNFWRSGQKVSGDEMCPVRVPTNPQNPIANKLPVVKIFGGERGFFSVSHADLLTGITTLNFEL